MIYHDTFNGKECLRIPLGFQEAKHIEDVVALTRDLIAETPPQCPEAKARTQRSSSILDDRLQLVLRLTPSQLQEHFPKHRLHPYVDLFIQCAAKEHLFDWMSISEALSQFERHKYAAARQRMIASLRAGARDAKFRSRVKAHQDKIRRNLSVIRRYTDAQFRHSRVLVIRVDCMFVEGFAPAHDWTSARSYREALIKFLNRDLPSVIQPTRRRVAKEKPEPLAGYIIGTEYGVETGWHFHVTLFLNGNSFQNDVGIAAAICLTWKNRITCCNGRYYNCNLAAKEGRYNAVGIGMIHRRDAAARAILDSRVTSYTVKGCYFAEAQTGTKDRLLNKGGWPKENDPKKGGRPETWTRAQYVPLTQVFSEKKRRFFQIRIPKEAAQPPVSY